MFTKSFVTFSKSKNKFLMSVLAQINRKLIYLKFLKLLTFHTATHTTNLKS